MFNSILNILKYEYKYQDIYSKIYLHNLLDYNLLLFIIAVHRLDKLTSGLLVLTKNQDLAFKFQSDMKENKVQKKYLARVMGNFPCEDDKEVEVDKSIYCVSPKLSKYDFCSTPE